MTRIALPLIAAALLAACRGPEPEPGSAAPPPETPAPQGPPPVTAEGWGPLRVGMTREEVVAAAGEDANPGAVGGPEPEMCDEFRPARAPEGMRVMMERGRLARITVSRSPAVRTDRGFGVGDAASAVKAAHPGAALSPHKYVGAPAEYIDVWSVPPPGEQARGIRYEVGADGRVLHVHAGGPAIQYVEGCL